MGFLKALSEFFGNLFNSTSPEIRHNSELRKIDSELKAIQPVIYKNNHLQPNLAELFRILYENTKPIDDLLSQTTNSPDQKRNEFFRRELLVTGFSPDFKEKLEGLTYENRVAHLNESAHEPDVVFASQRKTLENIAKELNSPGFISIDRIISEIDQLSDLCKFNFTNAIRAFDSGYDGLLPGYKPNYSAIAPEILETTFQDLYFITANLRITNSLANAIIAIAKIKNGGSISDSYAQSILSNLKKINSVFKRNLTDHVLRCLTMIARKSTSLELKTASYKADTRQHFATALESQFKSDEARIRSEIKDRTIKQELSNVFGNTQLLELHGYNSELDKELKNNCPSSFVWLTPFQILKSFVKLFLTDDIMNLLNAIVVEGFFNNPSYKTEFSQVIFAASETSDRIQTFEDTFNQNERNDSALITGYIKDSKKDSDFMKDLVLMVDTINAEAKQIIQNETTTVYNLVLKTQEILLDSKKPTPDMISNIKVLMGSTRNRETYEKIDRQFPTWKNFLTVMKNYVSVGNLSKVQ